MYNSIIILENVEKTENNIQLLTDYLKRLRDAKVKFHSSYDSLFTKF